jgi:hypothetical protein
VIGRDIGSLMLEDIHALVRNGASEGKSLEFKSDHYGRRDEDRREFAADVSAMANASGGDLVIGVEEVKGVASGVPGVEVEDPDGLVLAVSNFLRSAFEPEIHGVRLRWFPIHQNRGVLLIRVPRSWRAPHRVMVAKDYRFFFRDENGKHPMSVNDLRRSFLLSGEVEDRIHAFRSRRIDAVKTNQSPLGLENEEAALHVLLFPLSSFIDPQELVFQSNDMGLIPLGAQGFNRLYSLDGLVTYADMDREKRTVSSFSTLFRSGIAEAVSVIWVGEEDGARKLSLTSVELELIDGLPDMLADLQKRGLDGPFHLQVSLLGVRGLSAYVGPYGGSGYSYRAEDARLPDFVVDVPKLLEKTEQELRPVFTLMWNAFGQRGSPNYREDGTYHRKG